MFLHVGNEPFTYTGIRRDVHTVGFMSAGYLEACNFFFRGLRVARRFCWMIAVTRVTLDGEPTQEVTPPSDAVQNSLAGR